jgi:hypothetical protein
MGNEMIAAIVVVVLFIIIVSAIVVSKNKADTFDNKNNPWILHPYKTSFGKNHTNVRRKDWIAQNRDTNTVGFTAESAREYVNRRPEIKQYLVNGRILYFSNNTSVSFAHQPVWKSGDFYTRH